MDMKCQQTTSSETTTSMLAAALCGGCCGPICDRYIMRVVDTYYHEGCLQCTQCSMRLMHSCFQRNGKLYCRIDYERYVCGAILCWCYRFNDGQTNSNEIVNISFHIANLWRVAQKHVLIPQNYSDWPDHWKLLWLGLTKWLKMI